MTNQKNENPAQVQKEQATHEALNLQAINTYLTKGIDANNLAWDLDDIIFDFIYITGDDGQTLMPDVISNHVYRLFSLRDLFLQTALDNNEKIDLSYKNLIHHC